jgi:hypothetical protein
MAEKETTGVTRMTHDSLVIPPFTLDIPMPEGAAIPPKRAIPASFDKENSSTNNNNE